MNKFMIIARYFYFRGSYTSLKNGALRDYDRHEILEFASREEALSYLTKWHCGGSTFQVSAQTYSFGGRYILYAGEYSSPNYTIVKR